MIDPSDATPDVSDYELLKTADELPHLSQTRSTGVLLIVLALIGAAAVAAYVAFGGRKTSEQESAKPDRVQVRQETIKPLGGEPEAIDLPPLNQTDAVVRELVKRISSHPGIAAWLATDGLIRNFVVVVSNVSDGRSPADHLRVLRPSARFHEVERNGELFVDPASYKRYENLAAAAASIDPAGAARVYATLKPRIDDANRELGFPDTPFDRTLERALVALLETPVVNDPVRIEPRGATDFRFADPRLEALTGAQKQLLRTGPENVRSIQASLRAIALALGIPPERLPAPR
jgi:hypothetical protein